ncbi:hypothetical protein JOQ06_024743, partial [Pogonophryne albipinna]
KLGDMEEGITDMDCRVAILETANGNLKNENKEFKDKIERMEIQSRKFNPRVIGLKTAIEKSDPIAFVTNFLKEVFGSELSCEPAVEIAYRIGQWTDLRPRPMIVTMQRYQAKEDILKLARSKGEILFRDMRVNIFPDITPDIARKRALFNDVRMKLRKAEVMILNPAFMKHVHENWLENKGRYPSTGFMTVILSLFMCDQITVFGFGADSEGNWNHYYEILKNHNLRTGPHPGAQEYGVLQKLNTKKKISFYTGF